MLMLLKWSWNGMPQGHQGLNDSKMSCWCWLQDAASIVKPFFREPLAVHHSAWFCQPCDVIGSGSNQGWSFLVFERRRWDMNCGWKKRFLLSPACTAQGSQRTGLTHTGQNGACSGQVAHMLVLDWFEVLMKICVQDWNALLNMLKRFRSRNM